MTIRMFFLLVFLIVASVTTLSQSSGKLRESYDKEFKVGFKYPANWDRVADRNPIADETSIGLVVVSPPARMHRGQLFDAFVSVYVSKDRVSDQACNEFTQPVGDGSKKPVKIQAGSLTFYKTSDIVTNEGTREQADAYNIFHDGRCYSVTLTVERKNVTALDRNIKMVNDGLDTILRTLYFGK